MNSSSSIYRWFLAFTLLISLSPAIAGQQKSESILHMLDYLRVDYPATVKDGEIADTSEYAEMLEFSSRVVTLAEKLEDHRVKPSLIQQAKELQQVIEQRQSPTQIATLVENLSAELTANYAVTVSPRLPPSITKGKQLYAQECAACHGTRGDGNGPQASQMDPPPINFRDIKRQRERSIWGLYSAISQGVDGTAMPAFKPNLSEEQRWALAFFVSNFPFSEEQRTSGKSLWNNAPVKGWIPDLGTLTAITPAEAAQSSGKEGTDVLAYLRSEPESLSNHRNALQISRELLTVSVEYYRKGSFEKAYQSALSAYLEGFELTETTLSSSAPELAKTIEHSMLRFREKVRTQAPLTEIEQLHQKLVADLDKANSALAEGMNATMGFVSAFVILLREGLEAILLLAAIAAVLIKLGRRDTLPYLHAGWLGALAMGGVTWGVSNYLFTISGAGRELTEGLTALLACGVLLYVGFWLHDKTHTRNWRNFVDNKIRTALKGKSLWMLTFIAFLAVYREVFETVLFYQALWLQTATEAHSSLWGGIIVAAFSLLVLGWVILRSSIRLPLKLVFQLNAAILFILAVVFAGHGIAALQEAGWLPINLITAPSIDLLGIYPTLETLGTQLTIVAIVTFIFMRHRLSSTAIS